MQIKSKKKWNPLKKMSKLICENYQWHQAPLNNVKWDLLCLSTRLQVMEELDRRSKFNRVKSLQNRQALRWSRLHPQRKRRNARITIRRLIWVLTQMIYWEMRKLVSRLMFLYKNPTIRKQCQLKKLSWEPNAHLLLKFWKIVKKCQRKSKRNDKSLNRSKRPRFDSKNCNKRLKSWKNALLLQTCDLLLNKEQILMQY